MGHTRCANLLRRVSSPGRPYAVALQRISRRFLNDYVAIAVVMISMLASVNGSPCQPPKRCSTTNPAQCRVQLAYPQEAQPGGIGAQHPTTRLAGGPLDRHDIALDNGDRQTDLELQPVGVDHRRQPLPCPALPRSGHRVAGLEGEPPARHERPTDRGQRRRDVLVGDQTLEGVSGHDRQRELLAPGHRGGVGLNPLHVDASTGPVQGIIVRVHPDQPAGVARFAQSRQQGAGAAPDVQHALNRAREGGVVIVVLRARVDDVVQRRRLSV